MRGRADGYDPDANVLEEVKTYRGDFTAIPANHRQLHWAQARVYGWLLCQSLQLAQVNLALVYFDIVSEKGNPPSGNLVGRFAAVLRAAMRVVWPGPSRNWPIVRPAMPPPVPWPFPMRSFVPGSEH